MDDRRMDDRRRDDHRRDDHRRDAYREDRLDSRDPYRRTTTMEPWETRGREPLPPQRRPMGKVLMLSVLAVLMVATIVGTIALVLSDLRAQQSAKTGTPAGQATATLPSGTATPDLRDPKNNGWTQVAAGQHSDLKFAPSSSQRGYLCTADGAANTRTFGVTTDGGQTWKLGSSPAAYDACMLQVSATNPLDVVVTSNPYAGTGPETSIDAHYSTDGGATWKAAPFPAGTLAPGGALWSGSYLYVWSGPNKDSGQHGFLQVSANGGAFTPIDPSTQLPGAQNVVIESAIASATRLYLTIGYNGCSSQNCTALVASGDGGKTWAQVANSTNIWLAAVIGTTLYGTVTNVPVPTEVRSSDNGATWKTVTFPQLPGGHDVAFSLPAADGTFVATSDGTGWILRGGSWIPIPFSSTPHDIPGVAGVSLVTNGRAQRIWAVDDSHHPGVYWHAVP